MKNLLTTWFSRTPILASTAIVLGVGRPTEFVSVATRCPLLPFLRFSLITDQDCTLTIEGALNNAVWTPLATITAAAGVLITSYDLPTPQGDDGFLVITMPMIRIRLENITVVDQTTMEFYAALSNNR